jgi:hypothetical protein
MRGGVPVRDLVRGWGWWILFHMFLNGLELSVPGRVPCIVLLPPGCIMRFQMLGLGAELGGICELCAGVPELYVPF